MDTDKTRRRGGDAKRVQTVHRESPLIPTSLIDTGMQRLVVISLFVLIQAFKVYDLIVLKNSSLQSKLEVPQTINTLTFIRFHDNKLNFLFKYLLLDSLFLWVLPYLNIAFLNFNKVVTFVQITMMAGLNLALANGDGVPLLSTLYALALKVLNVKNRELTLLGDVVNTDEILDHSQYFKGRKTIKFLPDSLVELNPFENQWCIETDMVQVPVKFNSSSSSLDFLQVKYVNIEDNSVELLNYTSKSLKKMVKSASKVYYNEILDHDTVFFIDLPITEPGLYQINQVIDGNAMSLRLANRPLIVPSCPSAKFIPVSPDLNDMCLNDARKEDDLLINVVGLPPLTITYNKDVNGKLDTITRSGIIPPKLASPLQKSKRLTAKDLADVASWGGLRSINLPVMEKVLQSAGEHIYSISSLEDALGNKVQFENAIPDNALFYKFTIHGLPQADIVDPFPSRPLLENGSKSLKVRLGGLRTPREDSPYTASFIHRANDKVVKTFDRTFDVERDRDLSFTVTEPGVYELVNISSKYCSTLSGATVSVPFASKPNVSIAAEPIVDACVGNTGYSFNFKVEGGSPPFRMDYKVYRLKNNRPITSPQISRLEAKTHNFKLDYKPPFEGNYSIEFTRIKDQYYDETLAPEKYKYVTYLKQRPRATISQGSFDVCHGATQDIPVYFDGKAPFSLKYDILKDGKLVDTVDLKEITEAEYLIKSPDFESGGRYEIILTDVTDASSCKMDSNRHKIVLNVRNEVPELAFQRSEKVSVVEGTSEGIIVKQKGIESNSVNLRYKFVDPRGVESIENIPNFNPNGKFQVSKRGSYSLLELHDGVCQGKVSKDIVEVDFLPRPEIKLVSAPSSAVCVDTDASTKFELQGSPPFNVVYSVHHPSGSVEHNQEQSADKHFVLHYREHAPGDYKYVISRVEDSLYTADVMAKLQRTGSHSMPPIELNHTVWESPFAKFTTEAVKSSNTIRNKLISMCLSNLEDDKALDPVPIELAGQAPFNLKMSITNEAGDFRRNFKLSNIEETKIESYDIYKNFKLGVGTYYVQLLEIEDAHRCSNKNLKQETNSLTLKINDIPKIKRAINKFAEHNKVDVQSFIKHKINKGVKYDDYYCVGDHIYFQLEGLPPFNVAYKFNDELHEIKDLAAANFKRLVTKPGQLSLDSMSDSSAKNCLVNLSSIAEAVTIYDLPSVELFQGNVVEEDIHEGDKSELLFSFQGVPPFRLTYTRTIEDNGYNTNMSKKKRSAKKKGSLIVETEVVEGIEGYEYSVWTSAEGTYEAIAVEDSRCRVKNYV